MYFFMHLTDKNKGSSREKAQKRQNCKTFCAFCASSWLFLCTHFIGLHRTKRNALRSKAGQEGKVKIASAFGSLAVWLRKRKAALARPRSKTFRTFRNPPSARSVLECGTSVPLWVGINRCRSKNESYLLTLAETLQDWNLLPARGLTF
jgi:hypothetical protein